ncbi:hypothetical protein BDZ91DRAFT_799654 [Kalaharituber pfeilii]|nr:hypothetical protein BDZ91DRAFT_799654 [Kalaharituber pfeilii]
MRGALEAVDGSEKVLLLADSQAAISAVQKAGKTGKARTADLARVIELIAERQQRLREADAVKLAWVKAHVGIEGNEKADELAKEGAKCMRYDGQATEGGLRQELVRKRKEERERAGFGKGKFAKWGRRALTNYTWLRTGKGGAMWRRMVSGEEVQCTCGEAWSAEHVVFRCTELERPQRKDKDGAHVTWQSWEDLEEKGWKQEGPSLLIFEYPLEDVSEILDTIKVDITRIQNSIRTEDSGVLNIEVEEFVDPAEENWQSQKMRTIDEDQLEEDKFEEPEPVSLSEASNALTTIKYFFQQNPATGTTAQEDEQAALALQHLKRRPRPPLTAGSYNGSVVPVPVCARVLGQSANAGGSASAGSCAEAGAGASTGLVSLLGNFHLE